MDTINYISFFQIFHIRVGTQIYCVVSLCHIFKDLEKILLDTKIFELGANKNFGLKFIKICLTAYLLANSFKCYKNKEKTCIIGHTAHIFICIYVIIVFKIYVLC